MKWPFYSLNLNFIKHLWYKLKEMIYDAHLNIEWLRESDEKIQTALLTDLQKVWLKIDKELMKAEEWYTHF